MTPETPKEWTCPVFDRMAPAPITIDSIDDPRVEVYRDVQDRDLRGRDALFMAESELVIRRLLDTPRRLHSLLLSPARYERLRAALCVLPGEVPVYVAPAQLMSEIAGFHVHRGVLAAGFRPRPEALSLEGALGHLRQKSAFRLLLAEGITNVDNLGGLFRNAAAFGVDGVVLDPTSCDPLYRKAIRVSMGHVLRVPYAVSRDWPGVLARLKREWGVTLVGAEPGAGSVPAWEIPRAERIAVLLGSEDHGLDAATLRHCDVRVAIPMSEGVPSLNVATAAAVLLYELGRVR